ncbi:hypothetical protein KUCAC02_037891, partial [Chaenocephalus aceratus]
GVKASASEERTNVRKKKRGGYCECCLIKYENVSMVERLKCSVPLFSLFRPCGKTALRHKDGSGSHRDLLKKSSIRLLMATWDLTLDTL